MDDVDVNPFLEESRPEAAPRNLRDLSLPESMKMLVLAPHPDDFDAIGVTLKYWHERGLSLHVAVADTSSGIEDTYRGGLSKLERTQWRRTEQQESIRFFGLDDKALIFLSLKNGDSDQVCDDPANLGVIANMIAQHEPDIIFLPHGNDSNSAHRAMYSLVRQGGVRSGRRVRLMLNRDAKTASMRTDWYMPFGRDEAEWKARLLRFHDSQQQRNLNQRGHGFDERVLGLNRQIAEELGVDVPYAESFELELLG